MTILITCPTGLVGEDSSKRRSSATSRFACWRCRNLHRAPDRNEITVILGSPEDDEALAEAVQSADMVYHAATIAPPLPRAPADTHQTNVEGSCGRSRPVPATSSGSC